MQVCIPLEGALYDVVRQSETGSRLVHHLGARDVMAVPAGQAHSVSWRWAADIVSLQLDEDFVAEALGVSRVHIPDSFTIRDPFITSAAAQFRAQVFSGAVITMPVAEAIATLIAWRIGQHVDKRVGIRAKGSVRALNAQEFTRLQQWVDENLDKNLSIRALAHWMGMSLWHFMRRLNATVGLSASEYITARRMERAKILLASSTLSIAEIALEVGLSHSHFSRHFLRHCGLSPREYRKNPSSPLR